MDAASIVTKNILVKYIEWYFFDIPLAILKGWRNTLVFNLRYYSIPLLIKTFFAYWRNYHWSYGRGFDIAVWAEAFFSNMISRILGAIVRIFLIAFGMILEILTFFIGLIVLVLWVILPFLMTAGFLFGINLLI